MIRVMTFNVRMGMAQDGEHEWSKRRKAVAEMIRRHRPGLVGLQEAFDFQVDYLVERLPRYRAIGVGREDGQRKGEYALVMVDGGRFGIVDQGWYWLSPTPEMPSRGWGANFERIVTWAVLRERERGREFAFINTHWDHESEQARIESARMMRRRLEVLGQPAIVVGDFNCGTQDQAYRELLGTGERALSDAYQSADREEGTYHAFTGAAQGGRVDWILHTREFRAAGSATDRLRIGGLWPSDHFPVVAELEWV